MTRADLEARLVALDQELLALAESDDHPDRARWFAAFNERYVVLHQLRAVRGDEPDETLCLECGHDDAEPLIEHLQDIERSKQVLRERLGLSATQPPTVHAFWDADTIYLVDPETLAGLRGTKELMASLTTVGAVKAFNESISIAAVLPKRLLKSAQERGDDLDEFIAALPDDTPIDPLELDVQIREYDLDLPHQLGAYNPDTEYYHWLPEILKDLAEHTAPGMLGSDIWFIYWRGLNGRLAVHVLKAHGFHVVEE